MHRGYVHPPNPRGGFFDELRVTAGKLNRLLPHTPNQKLRVKKIGAALGEIRYSDVTMTSFLGPVPSLEVCHQLDDKLAHDQASVLKSLASGLHIRSAGILAVALGLLACCRLTIGMCFEVSAVVRETKKTREARRSWLKTLKALFGWSCAWLASKTCGNKPLCEFMHLR